jgi:hypothetical protein
MKTTKQLFTQGADEALLYTTQIQFHAHGDLEPYRARTSDEDLAREVMAIEKTMQRMTKTKRQLFFWPPRSKHPRLTLSPTAPLSEDFLQVLRSGLGWIRQAFPHHQLHPLIELFEKHMEARSFSANFRPLCQDDVDRLNSCVKAIRDEASSQAFRRRRDKHHKLVRSNTQGLLELTDRLFAQHSQILVVRIDLSYRRHASMPWLSHPTTEAEALNQRDGMLEYLRRKCPFKPVDYAWKLEFTEHTGWHMHFLLFFDANLHQRDLAIAEHICQHWSNVITQGSGRYFICNYERYRYRGVGKIHHTDVAKLWALRTLVIPYLTKADYYVRMVLTKGRTFGRSELTDVPTKKRGRPRKLPSARIVDFVPPAPPSSANGKKKVSEKRRLSVNTKTIVQPISPRLIADLSRASFKPSPSYKGDLGADKPRPDGAGWVV